MEPKERVLKLLEKGKITADEAAKLLEALQNSYRPEELYCKETLLETRNVPLIFKRVSRPASLIATVSRPERSWE